MNLTLSPVIYLILAHLIGDYVMQTEFLAKTKGRNNFILLVHVTIWTLVCIITLDLLHLYQWWHLPWLMITHMAMDWVKCHKMPPEHDLGWCLWVDQSVHLASLFICLL
jgi:hypothetical protein